MPRYINSAGFCFPWCKTARRLLLRNFKEGIDFEITRSGEFSNELTGFAEDLSPQAEIIINPSPEILITSSIKLKQIQLFAG